MSSSEACSFCAKSKREARSMIAGPGIYVCDGCVTSFLNNMESDEYVRPSSRRSCSFCLQENERLTKFIQHDKFVVCHECIEMCKEIVEQARLKRDAETSKQWYLMIQEADAKLAAREFDEAEPLYL